MAFGLQMTHQWPVTQATWEFPPFLWWAFQGCNSGFSPVRLVLPRSSQQGAVDHIQKGVRASFWRVRVLPTCVDGSLSEAFSRPSGDFTSYLPYDTVIPWGEGGKPMKFIWMSMSQTSFLNPVSGPRSPFVRWYLQQLYTHTVLCSALVIWVIPGGPRNPRALISNISGVLTF